MKFSTTVSAVGIALASVTAAVPLGRRDDTAASLIAAVAPKSTSCANAAKPDECRTNEQAAQPFIDAFVKYDLHSAGQIAAVLALTAFESLDYQFKLNQNPDHHGQGTSNMQMGSFNKEYAQSIPELAGPLAQIADQDSPAGLDQIRALVTDDKYNFGSGPWFLKTKCDKKVVGDLATGSDEAWNAYMTCVGVPTPIDPARTAYWERAKAAFHL
ncbi:hypothetical protein F5Y17DRAFT_48770 [Xylariaceae sp. FL0594]|nr:hypothetical protein F5Y17DRAFT_48770 [Xylariaceae sp. FL0594]